MLLSHISQHEKQSPGELFLEIVCSPGGGGAGL